MAEGGAVGLGNDDVIGLAAGDGAGRIDAIQQEVFVATGSALACEGDVAAGSGGVLAEDGLQVLIVRHGPISLRPKDVALWGQSDGEEIVRSARSITRDGVTIGHNQHFEADLSGETGQVIVPHPGHISGGVGTDQTNAEVVGVLKDVPEVADRERIVVVNDVAAINTRFIGIAGNVEFRPDMVASSIELADERPHAAGIGPAQVDTSSAIPVAPAAQCGCAHVIDVGVVRHVIVSRRCPRERTIGGGDSVGDGVREGGGTHVVDHVHELVLRHGLR